MWIDLIINDVWVSEEAFIIGNFIWAELNASIFNWLWWSPIVILPFILFFQPPVWSTAFLPIIISKLKIVAPTKDLGVKRNKAKGTEISNFTSET